MPANRDATVLVFQWWTSTSLTGFFSTIDLRHDKWQWLLYLHVYIHLSTDLPISYHFYEDYEVDQTTFIEFSEGG